MKIIKRDFAQPLGSATVWIMPLMTYMMLRLSGALLPEREWVWFVMLPVTFVVWFTVNFKISRKK